MVVAPMKESLSRLADDRSILASHSAVTLILTVLLKYGIAPIACIYLGYILMLKDAVIQKNSDTMFELVREQTSVSTKQSAIMESLTKSIDANTKKLEDLDRRAR